MYLRYGEQFLGLRPADGGEHRYYDVGIEHVAFYVDTRAEVDEAYARCLTMGASVHHPPEQDRDLPDYYELFVLRPGRNPRRDRLHGTDRLDLAALDQLDPIAVRIADEAEDASRRSRTV